MSITDKRLLKPVNIPHQLWNPDHESNGRTGLMVLPACLTNAHRALVNRHELLATVPLRAAGDSPVGGDGDDETNHHFVQAYDGSCARTLLALLDPYDHATFASNRLVLALAGNEMSLTDAPCGAGAAFLALLTALAELRREGVLPRLPLDVHLVGADISNLARDYAKQMLEEVRQDLEAQAVFVNSNFRHWDVLSQQSNMELVRHVILTSHQKTKRLLIVANFTGLLMRANKFNPAKAQLMELFRYSSAPGGSAIWIEPQDKLAIRPDTGLFAIIKRFFRDPLSVFGNVEANDDRLDIDAKTDVAYRLSLQPDGTAVARLAVLPINLEPRSIRPS
jgi:hypothetical protein